jgi:hypothetical protein
VVFRCYRSTHILFDVRPIMPPRIILLPSAGACPLTAEQPEADKPITVQEYEALKKRLAGQGRMVPGQAQAPLEVNPSEVGPAQPATHGQKFGRVGVTDTGSESQKSRDNGNGKPYGH